MTTKCRFGSKSPKLVIQNFWKSLRTLPLFKNLTPSLLPKFVRTPSKVLSFFKKNLFFWSKKNNFLWFINNAFIPWNYQIIKDQSKLVSFRFLVGFSCFYHFFEIPPHHLFRPSHKKISRPPPTCVPGCCWIFINLKQLLDHTIKPFSLKYFFFAFIQLN